MEIRVGHGYDLHRLEPVRDGASQMIIAGVAIDCSVAPIAHSDGDAVLHAVADAILSAVGDPDLGTLFPDTDPENENRDSREFLAEAIDRASEGGWAIGNVDITVLCDEPNISLHKEQICGSLRKLMAAPVNIKGKTHEGTSRSGAIEVHVVALVQRGQHS
ncbi:MAG: 2-C-methyl-D-erythritol 2,4-cyclodiphosphate synthase [Phycisphaerae bacterium]|jgi:2-C-methyl-D-erythritol 2,4-cyclodiphosphate synthase|nr:2-C-methyl-D-erythritol 2,4-cyclodiphosphate synthase [Phycisphaerae bacterium]